LIQDPRVRFSVSATTRPKRTGEVEGRDYIFLSPEEFGELRRQGRFLEQAEVHGTLYGTLADQMEAAIAEGKIFLLEIDVQGANQLHAQKIPGLFLFIAPPSFEELRERLVARATDKPDVIERRLQKAEDEYRERAKYDHVVVNRDLDQAVAEVRRLAGLDVQPGLGVRGVGR
jgi:guanylate kinase